MRMEIDDNNARVDQANPPTTKIGHQRGCQQRRMNTTVSSPLLTRPTKNSVAIGSAHFQRGSYQMSRPANSTPAL